MQYDLKFEIEDKFYGVYFEIEDINGLKINYRYSMSHEDVVYKLLLLNTWMLHETN